MNDKLKKGDKIYVLNFSFQSGVGRIEKVEDFEYPLSGQKYIRYNIIMNDEENFELDSRYVDTGVFNPIGSVTAFSNKDNLILEYKKQINYTQKQLDFYNKNLEEFMLC